MSSCIMWLDFPFLTPFLPEKPLYSLSAHSALTDLKVTHNAVYDEPPPTSQILDFEPCVYNKP